MALSSTDIKYYLSGGSSNTDPNASLGGVISSTVIGTNLFDDVPSAEASTGKVEYRCIYVKNTHATESYLDPVKLWISANTPSADTTFDIGLGTSAISGTEQTVASEATAPVGVTFSSPSSFASGLSIGTLAPSATKAIWIRRTVNAGAAAYNDSATFSIQGDINP